MPRSQTSPQGRSLRITRADLADRATAAEVVRLLDCYARDPMGLGRPLSAAVHARVVRGLRAHPTARVLIARRGGSAVGVLIGFVNYSTFAAASVLNVHDLVVHPDNRGEGIGRALMAAVIAQAKSLKCVRLTLEVRCDNRRARRLYRSLGFAPGHPPYAFWSRRCE